MQAARAVETRTCPWAVTVDHYRRWVERVAYCEFADELLVAQAAAHLQVCIRVIPHTPSTALSQWAITTYQGHLGDVILLGNNDVHYVLLASEQEGGSS